MLAFIFLLKSRAAAISGGKSGSSSLTAALLIDVPNASKCWQDGPAESREDMFTRNLYGEWSLGICDGLSYMGGQSAERALVIEKQAKFYKTCKQNKQY